MLAASPLPLLQPVTSNASANSGSSLAVDLHVTNLDQSIGAKEMKTLITSVFKQHVMVSYYIQPLELFTDPNSLSIVP